MSPRSPAKPGYIVEGVVETAGGGAAAPVEEAMPDWGTVLPAADVAAGKTVSVKCEQCHDTLQGPRPTRSVRRFMAWWTAPAPSIPASIIPAP